MDYFEVYNIDDYMATRSDTESCFFLVMCSSGEVLPVTCHAGPARV
jgi:hypothetical protein